jgi:hypothetical protein
MPDIVSYITPNNIVTSVVGSSANINAYSTSVAATTLAQLTDVDLAGSVNGSILIRDTNEYAARTISGACTLSAAGVLSFNPNACTLGTHTVGNYVASIAGTANQVIVTGSGSETANVTLSLPQSIGVSSSPTFSNLTLSGVLVNTDLDTRLSGKSAVGHTHTASDITNFNAAALAAAPVQSINTRVGTIVLDKSDVGLSNVDNTSDTNKPLSTATVTALSGKVNTVAGKDLSDENYTAAEKSKLSGIAAGAEVNVNADWAASSGDAQILNKPTTVAGYNITDAATITGATFSGAISATNLSGTNTGDQNLSGLAVKANNLSDLTNSTTARTNLALGNVDNTSDANKPVSTAQQTALNLKANLSGATFSGAISATNLSGTNTGDQTITLTGDVTGSGNGSFVSTLKNVGTAGTYNNSATSVQPFTTDAAGRISSAGTPLALTPAWSNVTNTPTTISGYSISDAVTTSGAQHIDGVKTFSSSPLVPNLTVDSSSLSAVNKAYADNIVSGLGNETAASIATIVNSTAAKTTPVDADTVPITDSAASHALKRLTFTNLWVWVKSKIESVVLTLTTPTIAQINGSTTASGTLTLASTTNATKGKILFGTSAYDEVNNRLGIGTASPTNNLHVALTGSTLSKGIEVSHNTGGFIRLANGASDANTMIPTIVGRGISSSSAYGLIFVGQTANDANNAYGVVSFSARNNAGTGVVGNSQRAFEFLNYTTPLITILGNGNVTVSGTIAASNYAPAANVAAFIATPTSDNLAAAVTDGTGEGGSLMFNENPTVESVTINGTVTSNATSYVHTAASAAANRLSLGVANGFVYKNGVVPRFELFEDLNVGANGAFVGTHSWTPNRSGGTNGQWLPNTSANILAWGMQFCTTSAVNGIYNGFSLTNVSSNPLGMSLQVCFALSSVTNCRYVAEFSGGGTSFGVRLDCTNSKLTLYTGGTGGGMAVDIATGLTLGTGDFSTGTRYRLFIRRISSTQTECYLASAPWNSTTWTTLYDGITTHAAHSGGWGQANPNVYVTTTENVAKTAYVDWIAVSSSNDR